MLLLWNIFIPLVWLLSEVHSKPSLVNVLSCDVAAASILTIQNICLYGHFYFGEEPGVAQCQSSEYGEWEHTAVISFWAYLSVGWHQTAVFYLITSHKDPCQRRLSKLLESGNNEIRMFEVYVFAGVVFWVGWITICLLLQYFFENLNTHYAFWSALVCTRLLNTKFLRALTCSFLLFLGFL